MSPRRSSALTMEHVLLALLDEKPMHGYELYQELSGMTGISLIWNIKQPLLYALLDKLEEHGYLTSKLVQGTNHPDRKYHSLTELGRESLQSWLVTPVSRARNIRQEFLAKLIMRRRRGKAEALELIQQQRDTCQAWLDDLLAHAVAPSADSMDAWLVYTFRLQRVRALLQWLEDCERTLSDLTG